MCTVTYLPQPDGCIISSNRDEAILRPAALLPEVYKKNQQRLLFPKDPTGGGTWIVTGQNATVCLFNGAFEPHVRKTNYRKSRGLIPLDFFQFSDVSHFAKSYDFKGIEPFSIVVYQNKTIIELKWDETEVYLIEHDSKKPQIWASATLYTKSVRLEREIWFNEWLASTPELSQSTILDFHSTQRGDDQNGLIINRKEGLKTVSVSSVKYLPAVGSKMTYFDLNQGTKTVHELRS